MKHLKRGKRVVIFNDFIISPIQGEYVRHQFVSQDFITIIQTQDVDISKELSVLRVNENDGGFYLSRAVGEIGK
jgi:hypothetical protein